MVYNQVIEIMKNTGKRHKPLRIPRQSRSRALPGFLFLISIASLSLILYAQDHRKELSAIQKQMGQVNNRLKSLDAARQPILAQLARLDLQAQREKLEIRRIDIQLSQLLGDVHKNREHREKLLRELKTERGKVRQVARYLYKLGGQSYLKLFLRVDSLDQLFRNYHLFMSLIQYHSQQTREIRKKTAHVDAVTLKLQKQEESLLQKKGEKNETMNRLQTLRQDQKQAAARINRDRGTYLRLLEELRSRAGELEDLIHRSGSGDSTTPIRHLQGLRRQLPWPLKGKVVSRFGRQRSTRFNTYILNNGIEIKPTDSDRIHAVYPGKIVFSNYFKGYGNLIIIQHAKNLHSLYGHCDRFLKQKGARVKSGESIAIVGESGSTSGRSLYFEIRTDLKPRDPLKWLKGK